MSTYNPRLVAQALEDLGSEITRWSSMARDVLATAMDTQQHTDEDLARALHHAAILSDRAKDDEERLEKVGTFVALINENCTTALEVAHNALDESQTLFAASKTTLQKWQLELEKSMPRFTLATSNFEKLLLDLEHAQRTLKSTLLELKSAESRLKACKNKGLLYPCRKENIAAEKARVEVTHARKNLRTTEQEVALAKLEVERATARVSCCKKAVALSTEAVDLSRESVQIAAQSVNFAERSTEAAHDVERLTKLAQEKWTIEVESAQTMLADTKRAKEFIQDANIHLARAATAEHTAQTYVTSVCKELDNRIQQVLEFNRPADFQPENRPSVKAVRKGTGT